MKLTDREQQVFDLIKKGLTTAEIAEILYISPETVKTHRSNMMKKVNAHNSIDMVLKIQNAIEVKRPPRCAV